MRFKSQIEELAKKAPEVTLPAGFDRVFSRFQEDMEEVVRENFPGVEGFDFDNNSQDFGWHVDMTFVMHDYASTDKRPADAMSMRKNFYINPRKDIKAEFDRVEAEYDAFYAYWRAVLKAVGTVK